MSSNFYPRTDHLTAPTTAHHLPATALTQQYAPQTPEHAHDHSHSQQHQQHQRQQQQQQSQPRHAPSHAQHEQSPQSQSQHQQSQQQQQQQQQGQPLQLRQQVATQQQQLPQTPQTHASSVQHAQQLRPHSSGGQLSSHQSPGHQSSPSHLQTTPSTPPPPPSQGQIQDLSAAAFAGQPIPAQYLGLVRPAFALAPQIANPYGFYPPFDSRMAASAQAGYPSMGQPGLPPTPTSTQQMSVEAPAAFSGTDEKGKKYTLRVMQEPIRARMCGFGDKDRRPITPPPCVLLEVVDEATGQPVDINELDPSYFVLMVDLWSGDGRQEVNLVRHSPTSPSISATTASSYPPQTMPISYAYGPPMGPVPMGVHPAYAYAHGAEGYAHHPPPPYSPYDQRAAAAYHYGNSTPITPTSGYSNGGSQGPLLSPTAPVMITQDPRSAPTGMFTRNLIGSLSVNAFKLNDSAGKLGIWFILQDLSVRTEGTFRLKFSFVSVGCPSNPQQLNTEKAPILAYCWSSVFQVFSAKKFPGVIESTPLSKCFATQGIKIPIRKDGNGRINDDDD